MNTVSRISFTVVAILMSIVAFADDDTHYTAGNQLIPLVETDISLRKEVLTLTLTDERKALVDVQYDFYNPAKEDKTIIIGFEAERPNGGNVPPFQPSGVHPNVHDFHVSVNDQTINHKNGVFYISPKSMDDLIDLSKLDWSDDSDGLYSSDGITGNSEEINYNYVYYFEATFKPGLNKIHHTYSYDMSVSDSHTFELEYLLSSATRWKYNMIGDLTLNIRAVNTAKHFLIANYMPLEEIKVTEGQGKVRRNADYVEVALRNGTMTYRTRNLRPERRHDLHIYSADYIVSQKFGAFYDRSSTHELDMYRNTDELKAETKTPLFKSIAKNLPYAHRGYVFEDATLKQYFESLWWYMPDPAYKQEDNSFTKADKEYKKSGK